MRARVQSWVLKASIFGALALGLVSRDVCPFGSKGPPPGMNAPAPSAVPSAAPQPASPASTGAPGDGTGG